MDDTEWSFKGVTLTVGSKELNLLVECDIQEKPNLNQEEKLLL